MFELIMVDGVLRAKSVIDKYNTNDSSWKYKAVAQSVSFAGGIGIGSNACRVGCWYGYWWCGSN
jgi:hypothetical protein